MTGRARESLFSILGHRVVDADVLDLYAGSGSLGLECLSRGARSVVFVERSRRAAAIVRDNVEAVGLGGELVIKDVADPPYADPDDRVAEVLSSLDRVLADDGIVILHRHDSSAVSAPEFLRCVDERRYGDAVLTMYERPPA